MAAAMTSEQLIKKLRSTRKDYEEECTWHRFLLDAAYGTGGFRGRTGPTSVSLLGWAAEAYAQASLVPPHVRKTGKVGTTRETYLDQFGREDLEKFHKRIDVAHYTNYVGPIHNLLIAYLNKTEPDRDGVPPQLETWMKDVDGKGTTWDAMLCDTIKPRGSLLGWCPLLFDSAGTDIPQGDAGEDVSQAREKELGRYVRAIPLFPVNVLDWIEDDDAAITAMKIRITRQVRDDLLDEAVLEERYALWYPNRVINYVVKRKGAQDVVEGGEERATGIDRVPIVMFRAQATPEDSARGVSTVANSAVTAKRHFNLESELDDHIRGQVFAVMGIPVEDVKADIGEIVGGTSSALKVPMNANMPIHFAAPPASVAEVIEKRIEVTVREIYRVENIEHAKATGTTAASGVARAYEFEQTNRRLSGIAGNFARDEQEALRLAGSMQQISGSEELTVTGATDFSVEDLLSEIQAMVEAQSLDLGPTAMRELRQRLVARMMPNLSADKYAVIEAELNQIRDQHAQDKALEREAKRAQLDDDEEDGKEAVDNLEAAE